MSTLQIGMAIAGGLVLAAVVTHNALTSRRNQPRQPEPDRPRIEPHSHAQEHADDQVDEQEPSLMLPPTMEKKPLLDSLIDVIADIMLDAPVSGDAVLQAMPSTRRVGSKPFAVEGLNSQTRRWESPEAGHRYDMLQAGVQLANRSGPLNDIEYSEFVVKAHAVADFLGATPDFPEMRDEVARARELDSFASEHDAQLSMNLKARHTAWSPGYVQQNAARLGFVAGVLPGRMVLPSSIAGQPPLLGLLYDAQAALSEDPDQTAIHEVILNLEVVHVARDECPYQRLRACVLSMAQSMDGVVTDGDGQPLNHDAMDQIGAELERLYDTLESRDMPAGSALARRLFS
jgi:hypothetical protein